MSSSTTRPACAVRPSRKLNKDNIADLELLSHRRFVETTQAPPPPSKSPSSTINLADVAWAPHSEPGPSNHGKHRPRVSNSTTSSDDTSNGDAESPTPTTSSQSLKAKSAKKKGRRRKRPMVYFLLVLHVFYGVNCDIQIIMKPTRMECMPMCMSKTLKNWMTMEPR